MDLSTTYLGLELPHPLMPGACPLVDDLDAVRRLGDPSRTGRGPRGCQGRREAGRESAGEARRETRRHRPRGARVRERRVLPPPLGRPGRVAVAVRG